MSWVRKQRGETRTASIDVAERLTTSGSFRLQVATECVSLSDRETVRRWIRELSTEPGAQVFVHRRWGTLAAVSDGRSSVAVVVSTGEHTCFATPPGATHDQQLTLEQVEHVVLDALTASERPAWPEWQTLMGRTP
jgi:hypothetical protein